MKKNTKLKILILGYSQIARKSIINSIEKNKHFTISGIASESHYKEIDPKYDSYDSYDGAINNNGCDAVYISLHNAAHIIWIEKSLRKNKHVICDKPAVLNKQDALKCYKLAGKKLLI